MAARSWFRRRRAGFGWRPAAWQGWAVRVAQQVATLASIPLLGFTSLISFQVIKPSIPLAVGLGLVLLAVDVGAWRVLARIFNRERLIAGRQAPPAT